MYQHLVKERDDYKNKVSNLIKHKDYIRGLTLSHSTSFEEEQKGSGAEQVIHWYLQKTEIRQLRVREGERKIMPRAYKDVCLFLESACKIFEETHPEEEGRIHKNFLKFLQEYRLIYSNKNPIGVGPLTRDSNP